MVGHRVHGILELKSRKESIYYLWILIRQGNIEKQIQGCNNDLENIRQNNINIMNPDSTKNVVMRYVINIHTHLFFVSLCQNMIHHSKAKEIMKAAITIYM